MTMHHQHELQFPLIKTKDAQIVKKHCIKHMVENGRKAFRNVSVY